MERKRAISSAAVQLGRYSWQHQLQGVLEFDRVEFANQSIVVGGSAIEAMQKVSKSDILLQETAFFLEFHAVNCPHINPRSTCWPRWFYPRDNSMPSPATARCAWCQLCCGSLVELVTAMVWTAMMGNFEPKSDLGNWPKSKNYIGTNNLTVKKSFDEWCHWNFVKVQKPPLWLWPNKNHDDHHGKWTFWDVETSVAQLGSLPGGPQQLIARLPTWWQWWLWSLCCWCSAEVVEPRRSPVKTGWFTSNNSSNEKHGGCYRILMFSCRGMILDGFPRRARCELCQSRSKWRTTYTRQSGGSQRPEMVKMIGSQYYV